MKNVLFPCSMTFCYLCKALGYRHGMGALSVFEEHKLFEATHSLTYWPMGFTFSISPFEIKA